MAASEDGGRFRLQHGTVKGLPFGVVFLCIAAFPFAGEPGGEAALVAP